MPIIRNNRNTVVGRRPALRLAAVSAGLAAAAVIPTGCSGDGKSIGEQTGITKTVSGLEVRADKVWGDNGKCPVGAWTFGDEDYRAIHMPDGTIIIFDNGFVASLDRSGEEITSLSVSPGGDSVGVHHPEIGDDLSGLPFGELANKVAKELERKIGECE